MSRCMTLQRFCQAVRSRYWRQQPESLGCRWWRTDGTARWLMDSSVCFDLSCGTVLSLVLSDHKCIVFWTRGGGSSSGNCYYYYYYHLLCQKVATVQIKGLHTHMQIKNVKYTFTKLKNIIHVHKNCLNKHKTKVQEIIYTFLQKTSIYPPACFSSRHVRTSYTIFCSNCVRNFRQHMP